MKPILQLTQNQTVSSLTPARIKELKARFDRRHYLRLPNFLNAKLLNYALKEIKKARFFKVKFKNNVGEELSMKANIPDSMFLFLLNDPVILKNLELITGCRPLRGYIGRLYRFVPNQGHFDHWHQDLMNRRKLALSINLSPKSYRGGNLQMRLKKSKKIFARVKNTRPGDALLFRLDKTLEHHVTQVTGRNPKTAYAGWFSSYPDDFVQFRKERKLSR